jgi:hypothetical protein
MNSKKKIYISIAIFVAMTVLLIIFAVIPLLKSIQQNSADIVYQKDSLASKKKEIETFRETEDLYQKSQENIGKIDKIFIEPDDPRDLKKFLEEKAEKYNLQNKILSIKKTAADSAGKTEPWPSLSLQISNTGSFVSFLKFVKNLESGPYLTEILNISIKRLTENELRGENLTMFSPGDVNATFLLKVYTK